MVYKLTSKVIIVRLRDKLLVSISQEQFFFSKQRQIHDAIVMAQEFLHTIKTKHPQTLILKLDLIKACDCMDWSFLWLELVNIVLTFNVV